MSRNVSKELKVRAAKRAAGAQQARSPREAAEPAQELTPLRRDPLAGLPAPPPSAATVAGHAARLNRATEGRISRAGGALRHLQRQYGNRYVGRVVAQARAGAPARPALAVQPKLVLGPVGDQYEREADRVARQVVGGMRGSPRQTAGPMAQRQADGDGPAVAPELEAAIRGARGGGQPLPDRVRTRMEQALGADFSQVRVHADSQADQLNQAIQARAFTTGQDLFFRQGAYDPGSRGGQALLAHELAHVIQQRGATIQTRGADQKSSQEGSRANAKTPDMQSFTEKSTQPVLHLSKDWVLQRTIKEDKDAAKFHLYEIHSYQRDVFVGIEKYITEAITDEEEGGGSWLDEVMAAGAKAWTSNYKNKAQGYLFEAHKVLDHHNPRQGNYAVLGADTKKDPDVQVIKIQWGTEHDELQWRRTAKEMKTSNSNDHSYFQTEMVKKGFKQLGQRNQDMQGFNYNKWQLDLYIGSEENIWPYFAHQVEHTGMFFAQKPGQPNLKERIKQRVDDYRLNGKDVYVHLEHKLWGNTTVKVDKR